MCDNRRYLAMMWPTEVWTIEWVRTQYTQSPEAWVSSVSTQRLSDSDSELRTDIRLYDFKFQSVTAIGLRHCADTCELKFLN